MESNYSKRVNWIDYAKAIGIILVIIGHVPSNNGMTDWLYSFHMPLFFFLTGITLKARGGYKEYINKLAKKILLPYILYSLLYFSINVAKSILLDKNINLVHNFLGIFIQMRGTDYSVGLWFLPLLFLSEVFVYLIILQKRKIQILIAHLIIGIGFIYAWYIHKVLPWGIDAVPFAKVTWDGSA